MPNNEVTEVAQLVQIKDSQLDRAEIMQLISDRLARRRRYANDQAIDIEAMVHSISLSEQMRRLAPKLVNFHKASLFVTPYKVSPEQKFVTRTLSRLRQHAHNLVIYYINMLGRRQMQYNESVAQAITLHQIQLDQAQEKIAQLEAKITHLEVSLTSQEAKSHE